MLQILRRRTVFIILVATGLLSPAPAAAKAGRPDFAKLDTLLTEQCRSGKFSGILVVRDRNKDVYQKACGQADPVNRIPITRNTIFRLFSTSKMLTALAVMSLVEDGKMDLDQSISTYVPDAPTEWHAVKLRELLNHTSGIADLTNELLGHFRSDHPSAMRSLLAGLTPDQRRLATRPGERFRYNNFGFELLADAAARAAGAPFASVLEERVFKPANMKTATVEEPEMAGGHPVAVNPAGLAIGYNGEPGKLEQANPWSFIQLGAGAVHAGVDDFVALDEAIAANKIVSASTWAKMLASPVQAIRPNGSISPRRFGLGLFVETLDGVSMIGHNGGNNGYMTEYQRMYGGEAMMAVLTNRGFTELAPIREAVIAGLKSSKRPQIRKGRRIAPPALPSQTTERRT